MLRTLSLAEVGLVVSNDGNMFQTVLADNKEVRPATLMATEKFLVEVELKYQAVIENKKSDEVTAYVSCVQNRNNNELSSSVIVAFYLTGHLRPVKFLSNLTVS